MAKKQKYYGTETNVYSDKLDKIRALGWSGHHNQFRIVCKATSMAEANRICESYDLGNKCFIPGWTSETGNDIEIEMCDIHTLIINIDRAGNKYIGIKDLISK